MNVTLHFIAALIAIALLNMPVSAFAATGKATSGAAAQSVHLDHGTMAPWWLFAARSR